VKGETDGLIGLSPGTPGTSEGSSLFGSRFSDCKRHGQVVVIKQFGELGRRVSGRHRESHHLAEFRLEVFVSSAISRLLFAHVRYRQRPLVSRIANRSRS
jgi:hypothetical protein